MMKENPMAGNPTQVLARFASELEYDAIPVRVREYCKDVLLDTLACALAGHQGEETHQVAALAAQLGQSAESSIIGGDRLSLAGATVLNGYLITAVTMCDIHRPTLTHITPEVIPAALAIAERDSGSGRELLTAMVAGMETTTRIGIGLDYPEFRKRGWHGPGVIGPFGAAAAVGRLLRFDAETMAGAFGLAGSQAAGTFAAWGTPTVKFHQCRGALSGVMAALLAQQKFIATREFLTAPDGGLYNTYSNGGRPDAVIADLGTRWELENIALRLWPSASTIQGFITAMFDLVEKHDIAPDKVERLRVGMSKTAVDMHGIFPRYKGKFEALLSTHYAAAAVLHDRTLTLAQFEPARYNDPKLARFAAERVEVGIDPALSGVQAVVEARLASGATISARCDHPRGAPENPLTRAQIEDKFRTYGRARLPASRIEEIIGAITALEDLGSARELMNSLRPDDEKRIRKSA
jgi:2-methylcitrate dehydratase PrpD